jgi:hypothetical protein
VDRFPAFFLIDQQGRVRLRQVGVPKEGLLEKKIEELLASSSEGDKAPRQADKVTR